MLVQTELANSALDRFWSSGISSRKAHLLARKKTGKYIHAKARKTTDGRREANMELIKDNLDHSTNKNMRCR